MKAHRARLLWLAAPVSLVCLVMIGGFYFAGIRKALGERELPDGTKLSLIGFTVGKRHESPAATMRQRFARWVPSKFQGTLNLWPAPATYSQVSSNYLSIWFIAQTPHGTQPDQWRVLVRDDQ